MVDIFFTIVRKIMPVQSFITLFFALLLIATKGIILKALYVEIPDYMHVFIIWVIILIFLIAFICFSKYYTTCCKCGETIVYSHNNYIGRKVKRRFWKFRFWKFLCYKCIDKYPEWFESNCEQNPFQPQKCT